MAAVRERSCILFFRWSPWQFYACEGDERPRSAAGEIVDQQFLRMCFMIQGCVWKDRRVQSAFWSMIQSLYNYHCNFFMYTNWSARLKTKPICSVLLMYQWRQSKPITWVYFPQTLSQWAIFYFKVPWKLNSMKKSETTQLYNQDKASQMQKYFLNHSAATKLQLWMDSRLLLLCSRQMYTSLKQF